MSVLSLPGRGASVLPVLTLTHYTAPVSARRGRGLHHLPYCSLSPNICVYVAAVTREKAMKRQGSKSIDAFVFLSFSVVSHM